MDTPIMELSGIVKRYGGTVALNRASLRIFPGEVHALMGGNGAGKSTIIGIIAGSKTPDSGAITLGGKQVQFKRPMDAIHNGIAIVYQELSLMPHLTVAENVAASHTGIHRMGVYNWDKAIRITGDSLSMLGETGREISPTEITAQLRAGQMQMVEIARAVSTGAKIILLDEPTSSLNFEETQCLFQVIRQLKSHGIGFLFVSHRMNEVREISDRITVFRDGATVVDGVPISEKSDDDIIKDMLGYSIQSQDPQNRNALRYREAERKDPVLRVSFTGAQQEFTAHAGEIIGVAGLAGSGRSGLLENIWGVRRWGDLSFQLYGKPFSPKGPKDSLKRDIAFIGEDRAATGLYLALPLDETLMMPNRVYHSQKVVTSREDGLSAEIMRSLKVKAANHKSMPSELSGGNQQKLLFGKWYINTPKLFLLDEPTRGVDINTKKEIYKLIGALAEQGSAVLVVSSEITELVELCHRVVVLKDGRMDRMLAGEEITEEYIMACITSAATTDTNGKG